MQTQVRYCDSLDFTPNSSSIIVKSFKANGLHDPQAALGGHQPRGFDEFMEVYKKFTVRASRISVTFSFEGYNGPAETNNVGAPQQSIQSAAGQVQAVPPIACMIIPSAEGSASGTVSQTQEIEKCVWTHIVPVGEPKTLATRARMSDFFGKDFLVGADGYTGDISSDPDNLIYYHIACGQQSNEYPLTVKVRANICITYDATFTEPKYLPVS